MPASAILLAIVRFACWETALFAASFPLARLAGWADRRSAEFWLAVLAIEVTLESSIAAIFSFAGVNSQAVYWCLCGVCFSLAATGLATNPSWWGKLDLGKPELGKLKHTLQALIAALLVPLVLLSFKPVEEIDFINYLHYLIEWLSNRATPYTFATNYVAFWE